LFVSRFLGFCQIFPRHLVFGQIYSKISCFWSDFLISVNALGCLSVPSVTTSKPSSSTRKS
jgi:hypothetical protein